MTAAIETMTHLVTLPGTYCGFPAQWTVHHVTDGNPARDYYQVNVSSDALVAGVALFGTTSDEWAVAGWLIGHDCSPRTCDYCDQPGTHKVIDATDEVLCRRCLVDHTDGPLRDYARHMSEHQRAALLVAELTR
ncbi:hypothetical protein [Micromonospora sp. GCM10011541]|uniref:hypothetical protein n=1 Tax=Micromonospora sp. GCM10011541 TaxID=3317336 RepID=UPI0036223AB6